MSVAAALRTSRPLQALLLLAAAVLAVVAWDAARLASLLSGCIDWQGGDAAASPCGRPTWSILSRGDLAWRVLSFDAALLGATALAAAGVALRSTAAAAAATAAFAAVPHFLAPRQYVALYPVVLALALATALLVQRGKARRRR